MNHLKGLKESAFFRSLLSLQPPPVPQRDGVDAEDAHAPNPR
jgi:hypothetical protein